MVIQDQQRVRMGPQLAAQRLPPGRTQGHARGVVRARRNHHGAALRQHARCRHAQPLRVHGQGYGLQAQAVQQRQQRWPARVFHRHAVAGARMLAQGALDRIQRTREDPHGIARQALALQPGARLRQQRLRNRLRRMRHRCRLPQRSGPGRAAGTRQQRRIGLAAGQVAQALGRSERRGRAGRLARYAGAAAPRSDHAARAAQPRIGGGDGVGIHPQFCGQMAHRGQGGAAWQSAAAHGIFKACRNVFGIASFYRQRWHAHIVLFVLVQIFVLRVSVAAIAPHTLRACTHSEAPREKCKK